MQCRRDLGAPGLLEELAFSNIFDFVEVHADGSVSVDLSRVTRDQVAAVRDVVVRRRAEGSGEEGRSVELTRIELCGKLKALTMLARHLGMFPISERRSRPRRCPQQTCWRSIRAPWVAPVAAQDTLRHTI